jgi:hypothetical protein
MYGLIDHWAGSGWHLGVCTRDIWDELERAMAVSVIQVWLVIGMDRRLWRNYLLLTPTIVVH